MTTFLISDVASGVKDRCINLTKDSAQLRAAQIWSGNSDCKLCNTSWEVASHLVKWEFLDKKDDHNKWHAITLSERFTLSTLQANTLYLHFTAAAQMNSPHLCAVTHIHLINWIKSDPLSLKFNNTRGFYHILRSQYTPLISILNQRNSHGKLLLK